MRFSQLKVVVSIALILNILEISLPITARMRSLLAPAAAQTVEGRSQFLPLPLDRQVQPPTAAPEDIYRWYPNPGLQPLVTQSIGDRLAEAGRLLDQRV